jgi:hypothetical protein
LKSARDQLLSSHVTGKEPLTFGDLQGFASKGVLAIQARMIATSFAIIAFLATMLSSVLYGGIPFASAILRGLVALALAYVVGRVIGGIMQSVIVDDIKAFKQANPLPKRDSGAEALELEEEGERLPDSNEASRAQAA